MQLWTDYPIVELGDEAGQPAPIRQCKVLTYDGNKYLSVSVGGITTEIKLGYIYRKPGRFGQRSTRLRPRELERLQNPFQHQQKKCSANYTIRYLIFMNYEHMRNRPKRQRMIEFKTKKAAARFSRKAGAEAMQVRLIICQHNDGRTSYHQEVVTLGVPHVGQ